MLIIKIFDEVMKLGGLLSYGRLFVTSFCVISFHFIYLFQTQSCIEKETNKQTDRQTHKQTEREAKQKQIHTTCTSAKGRTVSTSALEQPRNLLPRPNLALYIHLYSPKYGRQR